MTSAHDIEATQFADVESAIRSFTGVLDELQVGHERLEQRARRVEAELCIANEQLAAKVNELDETGRRLEAILTSLPTGVVVRDAAGVVVRVNDAAVNILDRTRDELVGSAECPGLRGAETDGELYRVERPDGGTLVLASAYSNVTCEDGEDLGSVEIIDDRTELTMMTEQAQRLDKMAALGTMAGGIAHEIRNPMNAIRGFATLLERRMEPDSKNARWAGLIRAGVDEADAIITSMLTFADPERLRLEEVPLASLVEEATTLVRRELEHAGTADDYDIVTYVEEAVFAADRIKLRQALRNLVSNAVEAQPRGGKIEIDATCASHEVQIRVRDAGAGIPIELHGRVTDPFFTTRAGGTGLGLALVHSILQLHGGALEIAPEPSSLGGAEVLLRIPTVSVSTQAAPQAIRPPRNPSQNR